MTSSLGQGLWFESLARRERLKALGVTVGMSGTGNRWDDVVAESFYASLEKKLIHPQAWSDLSERRAALFEYVEVLYSGQRLHSTMRDKTRA